MQSHTRDLLIRGKAAAKAGEAEEARRFFERLLNMSPPLKERIDSYYWLSQIETDPQKALEYVKNILMLDASEPRARRLMVLASGDLKADDVINPDQLKKIEPYREEVEAIRFVCSQCGGRLKYDVDQKTLVCEFCTTTIKNKAQEIKWVDQISENNFTATLATVKGHMTPVKIGVVACEGCGTELLIAIGSYSSNCPYCASKYVIDVSNEKEIIIPNGIIPFQIGLREAQLTAKNWMRDFLNMDEIKVTAPISGVYVPGWTFDIKGTLSWEADVYEDGFFIQKQGEYLLNYNDYFLPIVKQTASPLRSALWEFDLKDMQPFSENYLLDFPAEVYQLPLSDISLDVRQNVLKNAREEIEWQNRYQLRNLCIGTTGMYIDVYRLVLMPIWISQYINNKKQYQIVINGKSGRIYGDLPDREEKKKWFSKFLGI